MKLSEISVGAPTEMAAGMQLATFHAMNMLDWQVGLFISQKKSKCT